MEKIYGNLRKPARQRHARVCIDFAAAKNTVRPLRTRRHCVECVRVWESVRLDEWRGVPCTLLELARRGGPEMIVNTTLFDLSQFFHRIHKGKTQHNLTVVLVPEVGTKFGTGKDRYAA